jgi:transposase
MKTVEDYEKIRKAYYNENLSIRAINRKYGYSRRLIRKAIIDPEPNPYQERPNKGGKVLGPYQERIKELLAESEKQPRKQRYTAKKIYEIIHAEGYKGCEGGVHNFISRYRKQSKAKKAYLPLEFEPGEDAQVDWGEAVVELAGKRQKVQFFAMRLNYSRTRFVMAFPFQKQEAFLAGHIAAFQFYGGVPKRITYDNLKTAVYKILEGHGRAEQTAFQAFRSYYLFDSFYCNPAQGHEKGGIENDVGYIQRNFFSPIPKFDSFTELNEYLLQCCQKDVHRQIRGHKNSVAELWEIDKPHMLSLPRRPYLACQTKPVKVNPYSQVTYETNRYSVPIRYSGKQLVLRAYPFRIEVIHQDKIVAQHLRCFEREQDIYDPLHYLALLEQRPGAFHYAAPVKQWRKKWPTAYERLLEKIQKQPTRGLQDFIAVLKLHQHYPPETVSKAIQAAVTAQMPHLDGVLYQLGLLVESKPQKQKMDLKDFPQFQQYHPQPVDLNAYDQLLGGTP